MTVDDLTDRSDYELFLERFALHVIRFIVSFHRIVQVICVCVVILSSYT